jgi:FixJ family two-component response regulator
MTFECESPGGGMLPRIMLIEDETDLLEYYAEGIRSHGFEDIVAFSDTSNIVDRIVAEYTRAAIIVTDYYVLPRSPGRFLPELRQRGLNIPSILLSSRIDAEQLNSLVPQCSYFGFFSKGDRPQVLVRNLSQHLMDIVPNAMEAWIHYRLLCEARAFVCDLPQKKLEIARRLLQFEEVKTIAGDETLSKTAIYDFKDTIMRFVLQENQMGRYNALIAAIDEKPTLKT